MMSELEYERFVETVKGFTEEKKRIALRNMPDQMLWDELYSRFEENKSFVNGIKSAMEGANGSNK